MNALFYQPMYYRINKSHGNDFSKYRTPNLTRKELINESFIFEEMIVFSNAKINLGLQVIGKRKDGFHDIESVIYPVPLFDVIEFESSSHFKINEFGLPIDAPEEENIIFKAWELLNEKFSIEPLEVQLLKNIPMKSGLGGGSSNAAYFLKSVNTHFKLGISTDELIELSSRIGSDCPFFIKNKPSIVTGRGEIIKPLNLSLANKWLVIVFPQVGIATGEAYSLINIKKPSMRIADIISKPIEQWHDKLYNDFEKPVFELYPEIGRIKNDLYKSGALYASLTGSGSAVYGIFQNRPKLNFGEEVNIIWSGLLL